MNSKQILYGGDYNPDQWLSYPEILKKDVEYMKEAGINTVTLGVFAWSALEPREGEYHLEWLERIIGHLYENGISTILATPSGARPKWLTDQYPEVLRVSDRRVRDLFGGRHNHCYTSPVYREKVKQIDTLLAERFASHPAVLLWHISNEFGGECHCPLCQEAFRGWLRKKYRTIEAVNESWYTSFWSHTYQSFEQIESPSPIGEHALHGLNLDWKRFVSDQTADFARWEVECLRKAGAGQPVTVNMMYNFRGLNYDTLADCVETVSWDSYPLWHKQSDVLTALDTGLQHDYMRSLKHKPFLLMESCPSSTNWQGVSKLKRPGLLTAASLQAVAHGSDSVLYFQIRQSRGSSEKFHGAVIDHYGGKDTRVFQEIRQIGQSLSRLSEICQSGTESLAAVIYDVENRWAMEDAQGPRNDGLHYYEAVSKAYRALRRQGINVDIISEKQELGAYRLVAAPMLYLFREGIGKKLHEFVEQGGCLVMTYWSGVVGESDLCFLGETPHGLTDVLGLRRTEIDGLYDGESDILTPAPGSCFTSDYTCENLCELTRLSTAEPLMVYGGDAFYHGETAAARNHFGAGTAYYVGADAEQGFYDELYRAAVEESGILPVVEGDIPEGVEVCSRTDGQAEYVFVQNFQKESVDIRGMRLEGERMYPEDAAASMEQLEAYGTRILKRKAVSTLQ